MKNTEQQPGLIRLFLVLSAMTPKILTAFCNVTSHLFNSSSPLSFKSLGKVNYWEEKIKLLWVYIPVSLCQIQVHP